MAVTSLFQFTKLNGSDPAGHTKINVLIDSIDSRLNTVSTGLATASTSPGSITTGSVLRWSGSTFAEALVDSASIATGAVIEAKIGTNAVTTTKIADLNVTTGKIADNAVTLGTKTSGDYVGTVQGTANQIASTGATSGEGTTHTLSLVNNTIVPGQPTVGTATGSYPVTGSDRRIADVAYVNSAVSTVNTGGSIVMNGDVTGVANSNTIATGAITSAKIQDGTIAVGDLAAAVAERLNPVGTIQAYAGSTAPTGWLICNGDTVPNGSGTVQSVTADYSTLFSIIGDNFGSSGKLPDLRGRTMIGAGTGSGLTARSLGAGNTGLGAETHTLTPAETATKNHTHNFSGETGGVPYGQNSGAPVNSGSAFTAVTDKSVTPNYEDRGHDHTHAFSGSTGNPASGEANGSAHNNMQPSQVVNYIIKY